MMANLGPSSGSVTVYGAGVSGLTVAHELAVRGFTVTVVEPTSGYDVHGQPYLRVGGMAASQITPVDPHASDDASAPVDDRRLRWIASSTAEQPPPLELDIDMTPGSFELDDAAREAIAAFAQELEALGKPATLSIIGFVDPVLDRMFDASESRILARKRAATVAQALVDAGLRREQLNLQGAPNDGLRLALRMGVSVTTRSVVLPGEHGYRYFPSFYRHMFDTMSRIPLYDADGELTAQTAYDNLESSLSVTVARLDHEPILFSMVPGTDFQQLRETLVATLLGTDATIVDLLLISMRMLRYMSTCSARRQTLYENISLLDYLEAREPGRSTANAKYSSAFLDYLQSAPRVLAAIDPDTGDARTNANIAVQLMQTDIGTRINGTLNGPTSTSLFGPWVQYLRKLRVRFVYGELASMTVDNGQLRVEAVLPPSDASGDPPPCFEPLGTDSRYLDHADYIITALDAAAAERLSAALPKIGVPAGLAGYTTTPAPSPPEWTGTTDGGEQAWSRFQTMAGIQYFFRQKVDIATGHIYFSDSEWGLSSVSEQQFWVDGPNLNTSGYTSLISVDIGDFDTPSSHTHKSASQSTAREIAEEVWRQIISVLDPDPQIQLPAPTWYHLDTNLRFDGEGGTFSHNDTPLQVPLAGDWQRRAGADPHDPSQPPNPSTGELPEGLWQSSNGGYYVHWDRLIYAGTWKKTFTRITTMEAANESGRHAINAVLDHVQSRMSDIDDIPVRDAQPPQPGSVLTPDMSGVVAQNPVGAYARIWDPEQYEQSDFVVLKELDAMLFERELPHLFDVLMLETGIQALSQLGLQPFAHLPNITDLQSWTTDAIAHQQSSLAALGLPDAPELNLKILDGVRAIRRMLEGLLAPGGSAS